MEKSSIQNMNPLITVVVPVYKVEEYLEECVNSVCGQDYKNLEIILVDDGSPDNSGQMCDQLSKTDNRITVIHQENQGLSGARNSAIDIAKGDYITFVDSDDIIAKDMISSLYKCTISEDAEMAVTGLKSFYEDGSFFTNPHGNQIFVYTKEEALDCFLFNDYLTPCVCGKLYKMALWNNVRCPLGKLHEDQYTTYKLIDSCTKIVFACESKYYYRKRTGSIGHSNFSERAYDLYYGINEEYAYIKEKYGMKCPNVSVEKVTWELVFINMMICGNKENKKIIQETRTFARKNFYQIIQCPFINKTRKIQMFLFIMNYGLYKSFYLKYKKKHPMA